MKKGVTLIEIILSIGLIVLIGTVSLFIFNLAKKQAKIRSLNNMSEQIYTAANVYIETNSEIKDELYNNKNGLKIPLSTLEKSGLVDFQGLSLTEDDYVITMLGNTNPNDDHCAETYTANSWKIKDDEVIYICEKYDYSADIGTLETDVTTLKNTVITLTDELNALKSAVSTNSAQIISLQQTIESLTQTINILEQRISALEETKAYISLPAKWYTTNDNYIKYNGTIYNILKVDSDGSLTLFMYGFHNNGETLRSTFNGLLQTTSGMDLSCGSYGAPGRAQINCSTTGVVSVLGFYTISGDYACNTNSLKADIMYVSKEDIQSVGQCIDDYEVKLFNKNITINKIHWAGGGTELWFDFYPHFKWKLKPCMKITSGTGAIENPYILENKC